jgi:hypothetical protein
MALQTSQKSADCVSPVTSRMWYNYGQNNVKMCDFWRRVCYIDVSFYQIAGFCCAGA